MGSDFEDSGKDELKTVAEEDSWDQSSESDEEDEYGSGDDVEQSQLERYDGDGTSSPQNLKDNT